MPGPRARSHPSYGPDSVAPRPLRRRSRVTLNGIAKRAGFAPSNLLRYSREALLLRVVEDETETWLTDLFARSPTSARTITERQEAVAVTLAPLPAPHPVDQPRRLVDWLSPHSRNSLRQTMRGSRGSQRAPH